MGPTSATSMSNLKEVFDPITKFNEKINEAKLTDQNRQAEKQLIIDSIKRIKEEYARVEIVKEKEKSNLTKLDEKAILMKLKDDEKPKEIKSGIKGIKIQNDPNS